MIQKLSFLPNQNGFRFTGINESYGEIPCKIHRTEYGVHVAIEEDTNKPIFDQLIGWKAK